MAVHIVVDDAVALLLDVANDGGPIRTREREAVRVGVVHGDEIIRGRETQIRPSLEMQRDSGHIHGRHASQIVACVEEGESCRGHQVQRARAKRIPERGIRGILETRHGRAGVNDDTAVPKRVKLERVRGDGEQHAADADPCHLEVVEGGHPCVRGLGREARPGGGDRCVAKDERRPLRGVRVAIREAVREPAAHLRIHLVGKCQWTLSQPE